MKNRIDVNSLFNTNLFLKSIFFTSFLLTTCLTQGQSLKNYIDSIANAYLAKNQNLGLIIGVNNHGKEDVFYYGRKETTFSEKPDQNSIFEIGQITQIFTSVLYADMSVKGYIHADDQLSKFLPINVPSPVYEKIVCTPVKREVIIPAGQNEYNKYEYTGYICKPDPSVQSQPILLCYLSTHTSGLPDLPDNLRTNKSNPYKYYTTDKLYEFLKDYSIPEKIGYDFHYSNLGMALLGHAMELKFKRSFESLVADSICSPLGMSNTRIVIPEASKNNFLNGHSSNGKIAEHWTFDVMAPCGALHSNIGDMMKFLAANIGTQKTPLKDVLDYTHNPRIIFHNNKDFGDASIGLGWMISPLGIENKNYVWSSGLTGGFASFIGFDETTLSGVVIFSNTALPVDKLGEGIIKKMEEE